MNVFSFALCSVSLSRCSIDDGGQEEVHQEQPGEVGQKTTVVSAFSLLIR